MRSVSFKFPKEITYRDSESSADGSDLKDICRQPIATVTSSKSNSKYPYENSAPISRNISNSSFTMNEKLEADL